MNWRKFRDSTWAAVKPIAVRPRTWVVIIGAASLYVGKQLAPGTTEEIAHVLVQIITGL